MKQDFSGLKVGDTVRFKGIAKNFPNQYAYYWNRVNSIKIEVLWSKNKTPYAKRIV